MSSLPKEKIAVLAGGPSCEREISLISGKAVFDALSSAGWPVGLIDAVDDFIDQLKRDHVSKVFLALHGTFGEDGTVQRLLEKEAIAYTGDDALASELAFDKARAQAVFHAAGIPIPRFFVLEKGKALPSLEKITWPCVVKPSQCGSSVGVSIVLKQKDFEHACALAFQYSDAILAEAYIQGRELTVGILGDQILPVVEVIPGRKFYDYEAKYQDAGTLYEFPAKLTPPQAEKVSKMAWRAYRALGCRVMARVDLILNDQDEPIVLEVNTIPGLTGKSLLPKAAQASGIAFPDLCVRILELSFNGKEAHGKTNQK